MMVIYNDSVQVAPEDRILNERVEKNMYNSSMAAGMPIRIDHGAGLSRW